MVAIMDVMGGDAARDGARTWRVFVCIPTPHAPYHVEALTFEGYIEVPNAPDAKVDGKVRGKQGFQRPLSKDSFRVIVDGVGATGNVQSERGFVATNKCVVKRKRASERSRQVNERLSDCVTNAECEQ